jgi:hypothetical protein
LINAFYEIADAGLRTRFLELVRSLAPHHPPRRRARRRNSR